jgi:hypothetical protein
MHWKLTCCCIALFVATFSSILAAQNQLDVRDTQEPSTQTTDRFSAALEVQLTCTNKPDPAKAIGALQRSGVIQRRPYFNIDSVNYFHARRPLTVWGFKVVSVFGFDFNPRIFERGPGTAPPITIGVVVSESVTTVKSTLKRLGVQNAKVQRAAELVLDEKPAKSKILTDIYCEAR